MAVSYRRVEHISTPEIAIVPLRASRARQSLYFDFEQVQSSLSSALQIDLVDLYHLQPRSKALSPVEEHLFKRKAMAVRSSSHHTANKTHTVLNADFQDHTMSGAGLISRTAGAEQAVRKYRGHFFGKSKGHL